MKKYLFLLAWVAGSDSANGEDTGVNEADDLRPEFDKGNDNVQAYLITAPNEKLARICGFAKSFHNNYTAYDSTSAMYEVADGEITRYITYINYFDDN